MQSSHDTKPKIPWRLMLAVLTLIMALVFAPLIGKSQEMHKGHEHFHDDFYRKWQQSNGHSCCNSKSRDVNGDCAPLDQSRVRHTDEKVEVKIGDEWVVVPPEKIRPYFAPDFSHHLCNQGKNVLCLVLGGGV